VKSAAFLPAVKLGRWCQKHCSVDHDEPQIQDKRQVPYGCSKAKNIALQARHAP
jgi:hypothetical protein